MMESATGALHRRSHEGHLPTRPAFRSRWAPEPPPSGSRRGCADHAGLRGTGRARPIVLDLSDIEYGCRRRFGTRCTSTFRNETPSVRALLCRQSRVLCGRAAPPRPGGQTGRLDMEISGVLDRLAGQGLGTVGEVNVTFVARGGANEALPNARCVLSTPRVLRR